jgi:hypothetical protein
MIYLLDAVGLFLPGYAADKVGYISKPANTRSGALWPASDLRHSCLIEDAHKEQRLRTQGR